jgi:hypothetical protein
MSDQLVGAGGRLGCASAALALFCVLATPAAAWAQSNDANERQIAANKTATAAAHATFEAQNAGAITRHGAAEPTQTPWPTRTPTPTSTPVPLPAPTDVPATDPPTATPVPCAMQYGWTLLLDDQGDAITQLDDDGQVVGLWQDADGDQMWAPTSYFCPDSADTPTPTPEATDTPTPTPTVGQPASPPMATPQQPQPRPVAPAPARAVAPPLPPQVQIVERTVVVVATPTDTEIPTDPPAPTDTPEPTSTPTVPPTSTRTSTPSPISTRLPTPTWTPIPTWTPYPLASATPAVAAAPASTSDDPPAPAASHDGPGLRDPLIFAGIVSLLLGSLVFGPRLWLWAQRMTHP